MDSLNINKRINSTRQFQALHLITSLKGTYKKTNKKKIIKSLDLIFWRRKRRRRKEDGQGKEKITIKMEARRGEREDGFNYEKNKRRGDRRRICLLESRWEKGRTGERIKRRRRRSGRKEEERCD
jgi:hypothetical protein